jgi:hypothetical protein
MNRYIGCVLVTLIGALVRADEPKSDWVKIAPEGQKYEVQFPDKPKENSGKGSSQYLLSLQGGKVALIAQITSFAKEIDTSDAEVAKSVLDGGRNGLTNSLKGSKILTEKESKFNEKFPARDIDVNVPQLGLYRTRFILTPTTFYQVAVLGPQGLRQRD